MSLVNQNKDLDRQVGGDESGRHKKQHFMIQFDKEDIPKLEQWHWTMKVSFLVVDFFQLVGYFSLLNSDFFCLGGNFSLLDDDFFPLARADV